MASEKQQKDRLSDAAPNDGKIEATGWGKAALDTADGFGLSEGLYLSKNVHSFFPLF